MHACMAVQPSDVQVYRILLPMYEAKHEYASLADAHKTLARIFEQV